MESLPPFPFKIQAMVIYVVVQDTLSREYVDQMERIMEYGMSDAAILKHLHTIDKLLSSLRILSHNIQANVPGPLFKFLAWSRKHLDSVVGDVSLMLERYIDPQANLSRKRSKLEKYVTMTNAWFLSQYEFQVVFSTVEKYPTFHEAEPWLQKQLRDTLHALPTDVAQFFL